MNNETFQNKYAQKFLNVYKFSELNTFKVQRPGSSILLILKGFMSTVVNRLSLYVGLLNILLTIP